MAGSSGAVAPRARDGDTAERVLEAAGQLFRENGYAATSVKAIATRVGITTPALYWHFKSKDDMLFRFLERTLLEFRAAVVDAVEAAPEEEKLAAFVSAYVGYQLGAREAADAYTEIYGLGQMLEVLPARRRAKLLGVQREVLDILRGIVTRGREAGRYSVDEDLTVTAFALITLCEHVNTWYRPDGRLTVAQVTQQYVQLAERLVSQPS